MSDDPIPPRVQSEVIQVALLGVLDQLAEGSMPFGRDLAVALSAAMAHSLDLQVVGPVDPGECDGVVLLAA